MLPFFYILGAKIYSYPLIMGMAWGIAFHFVEFLNQKFEYQVKSLKTLFVGLFVASWLGAKVAFILTTDRSFSTSYLIQSESFWLGGGFVFYGGLIAGAILLVVYKFRTNLQWYKFNILLPVLALSHGVGRLGCLLAGCCYGKETKLLWAINLHASDRHPVQIYEAILLFLLAGGLYLLIRNNPKNSRILEYLGSYAVIRFTTEFFRGDKLRGIWLGGLSTSQIISLSIEVVILIFVFFKNRKAL